MASIVRDRIVHRKRVAADLSRTNTLSGVVAGNLSGFEDWYGNHLESDGLATGYPEDEIRRGVRKLTVETGTLLMMSEPDSMRYVLRCEVEELEGLNDLRIDGENGQRQKHAERAERARVVVV